MFDKVTTKNSHIMYVELVTIAIALSFELIANTNIFELMVFEQVNQF